MNIKALGSLVSVVTSFSFTIVCNVVVKDLYNHYLSYLSESLYVSYILIFTRRTS